MKLITAANLAEPDTIFEQLTEAHKGAGDLESMRINARLVLLLINHIGDSEVIQEAIELAKAQHLD